MHEPTIIETELVGPYLNVYVETPAPVPLMPYGAGESTAEVELLEWADAHVGCWDSYEPDNDERTIWRFVMDDPGEIPD